MPTKERQANILSISVGMYTRSYTVLIVEKFVERAKADSEPMQGYRPYRTAETAVKNGFTYHKILSKQELTYLCFFS